MVTQVSATSFVTRTKTRAVSYRHWKNWLIELFREDREHQAEDGADAGDEEAFEKDLHEDAAHGQADQSKHANGLAALVHEHDRQRQQEHGRRDDGDDGDGQMEALEHAKGASRSGCFAGGKRQHAWQPCVHVLRKLLCVFRVDESDVDRRDGLRAGGHIGRARHLEQVRQVQSDRSRNLTEPRRDPVWVRRCLRCGTLWPECRTRRSRDG